MKFVITTEHVFSWPVKMKVPDPKRAGAKIEQKFEGKFRYLPRSELSELTEQYKTLADPAERAAHEHDIIRRGLLGWNEEVETDDGDAVPFSTEALEQALEVEWFRAGVYRAYAEATSQDGARKGN